jgi:hypothetical protein
MRIAITALALIVVMLAGVQTTTVAADASWAWSQVCARYQFNTSEQCSASDTFADAYYGPPAMLEANFAEALKATAELMGSMLPPPADIDDPLVAVIQNGF